MLPKENRLTELSDFERIKKEGKVIRGNFFFLSFLENNLTFSRFGIIVSKRLSNKAVKRNRIKRLIREFIRNNLLSAFGGYDVVIVAKKSVLEKEEEISKELKKLFGLIKK